MSKNKESIINQLTQKPWEPAQVKVDNLHEGKTFNLHVGKLGLRYLMVVSTIMFCLFIVTYADRMVYDDWVRMPEPFLLWINTLLLVISSFVFIRIQLASKKNNFEKVLIGLSGGIDSALTATIAVDALGSENVIGVAMPSKYNSEESLLDAKSLAENLKIEFKIIQIEEIVENFINSLTTSGVGIGQSKNTPVSYTHLTLPTNREV